MLKIRLQRVGRRNDPAFRVVVTESTRGPKSGNNVELLGTYNPHANTTSVNADRVHYWVGKGARVSDTVHNILVGEKIIEGKKINVLPRKSPVAKEKEESLPNASSDEESGEEKSADAEASQKEDTKAEPVVEEEREKAEKTEDSSSDTSSLDEVSREEKPEASEGEGETKEEKTPESSTEAEEKGEKAEKETKS